MTGMERFGGRYAVVGEIGSGAMARVVSAHDTLLDRDVAVKVLRPEFTSDERVVRRFEREASLAGQIVHPNVVCTFDVGRDDGTPYIVMELVRGCTLRDRITRGALPETEAVVAALQMCDAVGVAHARGILHRDIKPANVLLTERGEVKLADFGLARAFDVIDGTRATIPGTAAGTAIYWAPEQARGETLTAAADLYALGVVLYEMLAGRPPFLGTSPVALGLQHAREPVPDLRRFARVSPELAGLIGRLLEKDPAERYPSAEDVAVHLRRLGTPRTKTAPGVARPLAIVGAVALLALGLEANLAHRAAGNRPPGARAATAAPQPVPDLAMVPSVVANDYQTARRRIARAGFHSTTYLQLSDAPAGTIVRQSPSAGTRLRPGARVTLILSSGSQPISPFGSPAWAVHVGGGN